MAAKTLDASLDELFAIAPEQFLEAREALAKELKATGDKDAAKGVKAQHKPTQVAHALNRLAREAAPELEALFEAGRALASGKDFAAALEQQKVALAAVLEKATGPDVPAIMAVVRGAQVDAALAEQVKQGRFSKLPEVKVGFFGAIAEGAPPPPPPQKKTPPPPPKPAIDEVAVARAKAEAERSKRELEAADERADTLAAEAEEAEQTAVEARRLANEAAAQVAKLRTRH